METQKIKPIFIKTKKGYSVYGVSKTFNLLGFIRNEPGLLGTITYNEQFEKNTFKQSIFCLGINSETLNEISLFMIIDLKQ